MRQTVCPRVDGEDGSNLLRTGGGADIEDLDTKVDFIDGIRQPLKAAAQFKGDYFRRGFLTVVLSPLAFNQTFLRQGLECFADRDAADIDSFASCWSGDQISSP